MRLIDADALVDDLMERHCKECNKRRGIKNGKYRIIYEIGEVPCLACEVDDVKEELEEAPTIEPERKKGKWIDEGFYADGHGAHAFRCSECGGHIIEYDADPFCKWCGADMRGEEDNIPIEYFENGGK